MFLGGHAFWIAVGKIMSFSCFILLGLQFMGVLLGVIGLALGCGGKARGSAKTGVVVGVSLLIFNLLYFPQLMSNSLSERWVLSYVEKQMMLVGSALQAYDADHGTSPPALFPFLTTPISYLKDSARDPYSVFREGYYHYYPVEDGWIIQSVGQNGILDFDASKVEGADPKTLRDAVSAKRYDSANGVLSSGDIIILKHKGKRPRDIEHEY
jgi:hypothetical protein